MVEINKNEQIKHYKLFAQTKKKQKSSKKNKTKNTKTKQRFDELSKLFSLE